jgi:hypothetical protein
VTKIYSGNETGSGSFYFTKSYTVGTYLFVAKVLIPSISYSEKVNYSTYNAKRKE